MSYATDNVIADRGTGDWVLDSPVARVIRAGETGVFRYPAAKEISEIEGRENSEGRSNLSLLIPFNFDVYFKINLNLFKRKSKFE